MNTRPWPTRLAITILFFINGFIVLTWAARIPTVKSSLGLGQAAMGAALLCASLGALPGLNIGGALAARFGARRVATPSGIALALALVPISLAPNLVALAGALFVLGACLGLMDVSMNVDAVSVEKLYQRSIMSAFHAFYSWGGLSGAATGALAVAYGISPRAEFLAAAAASISVLLLSGLLPNPILNDKPAAGPAFARPTRAVLAIGVVAFCVALVEGSMSDWGALYLHGAAKTSLAVAALGLGAFSVTMATGRLAGDRLADRHGRTRLVRSGFAVCCLGLGLALLVPIGAIGILGLALVGAGAATIFPLAMSAAGSTRGHPAAHAIAAAATCGYTAFLVGPVAIGLLAQVLSLRVALVLVLGVAATGFTMAGAVAPADGGHPQTVPAILPSQPRPGRG